MNTERLGTINAYIAKNGEAGLTELHSLFPDVSTMTIRRDIEYLEKQGYIRRIRGGAKAVTRGSNKMEEGYSLRMSENIRAKETIAKKAAHLFPKDGSMYFDSGTTIMCLSRIIPEENYFVLTSGPAAALEIIRHPSVTVVLTGGNLNRDNLALSGSSAIETAKNININTAFIATSGFSLESGFTCGNFDECELKRVIIGKANKIVLLMDQSKLGRHLPYTFARLEDIDYLVTEGPLPADIVTEAAALGTIII